MRHRRASITVLALLAATCALGRPKFLPDDPLRADRDDLPIAEPAVLEISPTMDILENTFGDEGGPLVRAQNTNTLGEVPDSSWFTNRLGLRLMTVDEIVRGGDTTGGPAPDGPLTIEWAGLGVTTEGICLRDRRGHHYYIKVDPRAYPNMATGADLISTKLLHAAGYNVMPTTIAYLDPARIEIAPDATIRRLGGKQSPLDEEFLEILLQRAARTADGKVRVSANRIPNRPTIGKWRFYGTRSDDLNDIFAHENRRELRGLRLFAAWLNHYNCVALNTADFYVGAPGERHVRHYLLDFTTALGSGYDLEGKRIIPKERRAGNSYILWRETRETLKTAFSLGIYERPWMRVAYPYPRYAEAGRIEADFFTPEDWKPDYPNAAFDAMLPDDALWAADILARVPDEAVRAVVEAARFDDPETTDYLSATLIRRRDKILRHYTSATNPIVRFRVDDDQLTFENLGETVGHGIGTVYLYQWYAFDNETQVAISIGDERRVASPSISLPSERHDYWKIRIQTERKEHPEWRHRVDVFIRTQPQPVVIGIDRETGFTVLERPAPVDPRDDDDRSID